MTIGGSTSISGGNTFSTGTGQVDLNGNVVVADSLLGASTETGRQAWSMAISVVILTANSSVFRTPNQGRSRDGHAVVAAVIWFYYCYS